VAVLEPDKIGRSSVVAADFDDLPVPVGKSDVLAVDKKPVTLRRVHAAHLQCTSLRLTWWFWQPPSGALSLVWPLLSRLS
jgi:hypothetical protein